MTTVTLGRRCRRDERIGLSFDAISISDNVRHEVNCNRGISEAFSDANIRALFMLSSKQSNVCIS